MGNIQRSHFSTCPNYSKRSKLISEPRVKIMIKALLSMLAKNQNFKVLDVGCSDGYIYRKISKKYKIFGVDIAENFVREANRNGLIAKVCDLENEKIPFGDESFDIVITGETIEHIVNTDFFLSEINRVFKKNGRLVLSYPNINTLLGIAMMIFFDLPPRYSARFRSVHVRDWTKKMVVFALKEFGFEVDKLTGSGFYLPKIGFFSFFGLGYFAPRLSYSAIAIATKRKNVMYDDRKITSVELCR